MPDDTGTRRGAPRETPVVSNRGDGGTPDDGFFTFACQPLHDAAGRVAGVLLQGVEATDAVHARRGARASTARRVDPARAERRAAHGATATRARADAEPRAPTDGLREANQRLVLAGLHEQELAEASEDARRRSAFLARASRHLAAPFDDGTTPRTVAALAVPTVADVCFFDAVAADGSIRRVGWGHADPAEQAKLDALRPAAPAWERPRHPVVRALLTGASVVVPEVTAAWRRDAGGAEQRRFLRALGVRSLLTVPLPAGGRRLGALTFCFTARSERRYGPDDLALAEDLAGRVALAIDNARLDRELRRALRVRDDFLAVTAHDLRAPLTTISGNAQLWRRRAERADAARPLSPAALAEGMARIEDTAAAMTGMIAGLLDAARLQAGQVIELDRAPVDLVALVRRVAASVRPADEAGAVRVEAGVPTLVGRWDAARLERVLVNLIGNAVKYSPDGGRVTVSLRATRTRTSGTRPRAVRGPWAELAVRDEGIGIPAADRPRLFEWFHRGTNAVGRIAGVGVGLAGSRAVVEQHGGTITVESREGEGSTFTVRLPLGAPPAA